MTDLTAPAPATQQLVAIVNNHPQAMPLQSRQKDDNDQLTQGNSDIGSESPSSKRPFQDDAKSLVPICLSFSPPDDNDHLLINAFNATDAFYKPQQSLQTQKWKLSLEDHIHYALACATRD